MQVITDFVADLGLAQSWLSSHLGAHVLLGLEFLAFALLAAVVIFVLALASAKDGFGERRKVFVLNALLLIVLLTVALLRVYDDASWLKLPTGARSWLKPALHGIWFAMLGSVAISLKGVYDHRQAGEWDQGWLLWYLGRPLSGAIVGAMTYLLLQVADPNHPPSLPALSVAAFVLGTQERRFFGFLSEVGKLVVTTPDSAQEGTFTITNVTPKEGRQGGVLLVTGSGFQAGAIATLGGGRLDDVQVAPDGSALTGTVPAGVSGNVDLVVANPSGAAYRTPGVFTVI